MRNKYLASIITFAVVLCIFCTSVTVFATGDETTSPAPTEAPATTQTPPEPTTQNKNPGGLVDDEDETTTKRTTTTEPVIVTERNTTTTKQTSSSTTTTRHNTGSSNTTTTRRTDTDRTTRAESTESDSTTLLEGQFYVHLVLGNGKEDQDWLMEKAGKVPVPTPPTRDGYIFEGWYSDPEFTKLWDFNKDKATEEITIYAKWSVDPATVFYKITVSPVTGGKITVSSATASAGTPIVVTVKPDSGKRLAEDGLIINGEKTNILSFDMPAEDVVISAKFEDIPATVDDVEKEDNSIIYILVGAGILVVGLIIAGVVMLRRKNEIIVPEFDENGAVIIDDDEEIWVDESLVIEDAFPDAKPVSTMNENESYNEDAVPVEKVNKYEVITDDALVEDNDAKLAEAVEEAQTDVDNDVKIDPSLFK